MGCDSDETKSTIRQDFLFGQVTLFIAAKHVATFLFINIFIFGMVVWEWWIMAIPYRFPSNLAIKSSGPLHDLLFLFNQKTYFKHACQEYNVNSKFFTLFYCTTLKLELHMSIKTKPEILNIPVLPRTRIFILYVVFLWYISVFCSRQL